MAKDKPRPGKNSDGQAKGKTNLPKPAPPNPAARVGTNPMTHPNHPALAPPRAAPQFAPADVPNAKGVLPGKPTEQAGAAGLQEQSRQNINFRDLPPPMQMQVESQQGLDPMAPIKQLQQTVAGAQAQGPTQGPVPNELAGPGVPPGLESFPDDMAHLQTLMQQGLGPGSSPQEHQLGLNASAIARAHAEAAMHNAQNSADHSQNVQALGGMLHAMGSAGTLPAPQDVAAHVANAMSSAAPQPGPPQLGSALAPPPPGSVPPGGPVGAPSGPLGASPDAGAAGPPTDPNAPGGIPPAMIAALSQGAQKRKPGRK